MSTQLEKIERIASQKTVRDQIQIAELLDRFLGRSLQSLAPASAKDKTYVSVLANDLAKGFECPADDIRQCSVGDILMMFTKEETVEFFSVPAENTYGFSLDIPTTSGHCYYLVGSIHNYGKNDIREKALMSVEFNAFIAFLRTAVRAEYTLGNLAGEDYDESIHRIGNAKTEIIKFCREHGINLTSNFTLGDVLETAFKDAVKPWFCHVCELTTYGERVAKAFRIMDLIFMDCITNALVIPNAERYSRGIELIGPIPDDEDIILTDPDKEAMEQFIKRVV